MAEEVSHTKDIVIAVLDTIAFLLVIPEVLIRVRPWIQKGTSVAWRIVVFIVVMGIWIFADEIWVDVLPYWFLFLVLAALVLFVTTQVMTDTAPDKWLFDKHADVAKWVADRLLWFGVGAFILARLVAIFA